MGLLFSGGLPSQLLCTLQSIRIAGISTRTFLGTRVNALFNELQGAGLVVGADGRCDSMGHCAKYSSYTAVDLDRNKVLTVELVQSNEVQSSHPWN